MREKDYRSRRWEERDKRTLAKVEKELEEEGKVEEKES